MVDRPATASTLCTVSSGQSFLTSLIPTSVGGATKVFDVDSALTDTAISGAYVDEIFFRYVVAQVKIAIGRMIMTFGYNLPGNVTINGDMIKDDGKEELEQIKEEIKGDEGVDFFMHS